MVNYFGFNSQLNSKSVKPSPESNKRLFSPKIISLSENAKPNKIDLEKISTVSAFLLYCKTLDQMNKNGYIEEKNLNDGPV